MHFLRGQNPPKIPIFSTFINNQILETLKEKITAWYMKF